MKLLATVCLILNSVFWGYSQSNEDALNGKLYYKYINEAELLAVNDRFYEADSVYRLSFSLVDRPFVKDLVKASKNCISINDSDSFMRYVNQTFLQGIKLKQIKEDEALSAYIQEHDLWTETVKNYRKNKRYFKSSINKKLRKKINKLVFRDQIVRNPIVFLLVGDRLMQRRDPKTFSSLVAIILEHGYPGFSSIGETIFKPFGFSDISLLMRHMDVEMLDSLNPYFLEAIDNLELTPYNYASAYDYATFFKKHLSGVNTRGNFVRVHQYTYGTLFFDNVSVVKNYNYTDSLRASIGLESISDFSLKYPNRSFYEGYQRKEYGIEQRVIKHDSLFRLDVDSLANNLEYNLVTKVIEQRLENCTDELTVIGLQHKLGLMYAFIGNYTQAKYYFQKCLSSNAIDDELKSLLGTFLNQLEQVNQNDKPFIEIYTDGAVLYRDIK